MYYNVPLLAPHFANDANSEYITHEPTNKEQNEGTERVEDLENGIEEEDEIPVGLQYSFKVINRLKIFCICMSILNLLCGNVIFCIVFALGACFPKSFDLCLFHAFYTFIAIFYYSMIVLLISVIAIFLVFFALKGIIQESYINLTLLCIVILLVCFAILYYPNRAGKFLKDVFVAYSYLPYDTIKDWYLSKNWGADSSIDTALDYVNQDE